MVGKQFAGAIDSTVSKTRLAAMFVAVSLAGCGGEAKPAVAPPTATTAAVPATPLAPAAPGKTNSTIYLSDRLRKACGITTVDTVKDTPKFDFDQSAILPEDRDVLTLVAQCLTTGPLKGRAVRLVGRADPRGSAEYNMALGERRSNAVLKYLTALGVASAQLSETSRGSLDAVGNDEAAWREDRRVDIDLVEPAS
jgi:peptidoglycan-associated lipoprotein